MKRSGLWSVCGLALLISFLMSAESSAAPNWVTLDTKGNVRSFYGIPITLTRAGLKRLPYRVRKGYYYAEGDRYTKYRITAKGQIDVFVTFERNGKLASAWTESPNAVGLKGMRVGSTLADLRAAWPDGDFRFYWEDGYVVTFRTPANVSFMFDEKDMPPGAFDHDRPMNFPVPDNIKVKTIAVFPRPRPPQKKEREPVDLNKTETTTFNAETNVMLSKLEMERIVETSSVRLVWHNNDKVRFDRIIDLSKYPDFDIHSADLLYPPDPLVVSFRYGNFKDCTVRADDRDKVYVKLDGDGASVSSHPPEGSRVVERDPTSKYAGPAIGSVAHGCRRTFDPKTGASGLERAD